MTKEGKELCKIWGFLIKKLDLKSGNLVISKKMPKTKYKTTQHSDVIGSNIYRNVIWIKAGLSRETRINTFLHEMAHSYVEQNNLTSSLLHGKEFQKALKKVKKAYAAYK